MMERMSHSSESAAAKPAVRPSKVAAISEMTTPSSKVAAPTPTTSE
jgi:hypothetical protein